MKLLPSMLLPFRLLRPMPVASFLLAAGSGFLADLSGIALMGASAWLIATAALHPPLYALTLGIVLVRACGLGRALFRYLDRWLSHRASFSMLAGLHERLYRTAARQLPRKEGKVREGELLHDLGAGCDLLRDFCLRAFFPPLLSLLPTLPAVAWLWPLTGAGSLLLPLVWLLCLICPAFAARNAEERRRRSDASYRDELLDLSMGLDELLAAGSASIAQKRLDRVSGQMQQRQETLQREENGMDFAASLACSAAFLLLLHLLIPCAASGRISGVDFAVWLLLLLSLLETYRALPGAARAWMQAASAARRMQERDAQEIPSSRAPATSAERESSPSIPLHGQNLRFSYRPGLPVLDGLSLVLPSGSKTALVGESGSGKTTLLHLLLGIWEPDRGIVLLQGKDIRSLARRDIADAVAASTEASYVFGASLRENFQLLHPGISEHAIWESLAICQLKKFADALPGKLDAPLGEDAARLSGGERKRLQTALALAGETPMLILDEPTAGLDKKTAHRLMHGLIAHAKGRTLLIITHDLPLAQQMDAVQSLEKGKCVSIDKE